MLHRNLHPSSDCPFSDLIFKNQAISTRDKPTHFVNDLLRTEFHKFVFFFS